MGLYDNCPKYAAEPMPFNEFCIMVGISAPSKAQGRLIVSYEDGVSDWYTEEEFIKNFIEISPEVYVHVTQALNSIHPGLAKLADSH